MNMNDLPNTAGTYLLQLNCRRPAVVEVGKAGPLHLQPGVYLYIGSAFGPGGLATRLRHHLQPAAARPHWHLDYLRPNLQPAKLWYTTDPGCWEHHWATVLAAVRGMRIPQPGLGASDCRCASHLFYRLLPLGRATFRSHMRRSGQMPPRLRELLFHDG